MPVKGCNKYARVCSVHRTIEYRLLPGSKSNANKLGAIAGACRFVWNAILAQCIQEYKQAEESGEQPPSVKYFFPLGKWFKELRDRTEWLQKYSFSVVRTTLKVQADAWKACFNQGRGKPKFRAKYRSTPSFAIPEAVKIRDGRLFIPKLGYLKIRRKGGNPYPDGVPVKAVILQRVGKSYACICYKIEAPEIEDNGVATGIDRNCGQVAAVSTDGKREIIRQPDGKRKTARLHRYQRKSARQQKGSNRRYRTKKRLQKAHRAIAMTRRNTHHQASRRIANRSSTVVLEDLDVVAMTSSARGTVDNLGRNVARKARLNRSINATGWGQLDGMLQYKCREVLKIPAPYTSQNCNKCGRRDKANRLTQSTFKCISCGYTDNADLNAAANILASGIGATARRGAFGLPTPLICEIDTRGYSRI